MPTYPYSCTECGHFFEQVQSFSEASLTTCPVCSGRLRKVFNAVGVVFKGSGFYRTDSRAPAGDGAAPKSGGSGEGSGGGSGESSGGSEGGSTGGSAPATKKSGESTSAPRAATGSKGSSDAA